jgi:DUF971 family protein
MVTPEVSVLDAGESIAVTLADGTRRSVAAATLWTECPSALGRRRRIDGTHLAIPRGLKITELAQVGAYGLHITFSADARAGVYPRRMLAELSQRPQVNDFITAAP